MTERRQLTMVSINGPYRDEAIFTMMRLAHAAKEKGVEVNFFNYLDSTVMGHRDQAPKEFPTIETIYASIIKKGLKNPKADAIACIKCTDARGVTKYQTEGIIIGGLYDLAEWQASAGNEPSLIYVSGGVHSVVTGQKTGYGDLAVWLKDVPSIEAEIKKNLEIMKFYALAGCKG